MMEVRSAGAACTLFNSIHVMGGTDAAHKISSTQEVLDPDTLRWAYRRSMPFARMDAAAVGISDSILLCGGQDEEVSNNCVFYRPELDEWQNGPEMNHRRYGHRAEILKL
eukprot:Trichotokara_eunicae@DN4777_c0_g1_i1.p1